MRNDGYAPLPSLAQSSMPKKLQRRIPAPKASPAAVATRSTGDASGGQSLFGRGRVTAKVLAEFTSQLAVLLNAGIPITKSLRILEGQMPQGAMKRIAGQLVEDVEPASWSTYLSALPLIPATQQPSV